MAGAVLLNLALYFILNDSWGNLVSGWYIGFLALYPEPILELNHE